MPKSIKQIRQLSAFLDVAVFLLVILISCSVSAQDSFVWLSRLEAGKNVLVNAKDTWGLENLTFHSDTDIKSWAMRAFIPKGSYDPASMINLGLPMGGAGFKRKVIPSGADRAILTYRVRFAENFDFVRGGKLPGLYGGNGDSGGVIPDGADGFSFRLMWGPQGEGCVYAYLPTSVTYGTPLLQRQHLFVAGSWQTVKQEIILNHLGKADGTVRLWIDGRFIGEATGLVMRTVDSLKIDGLFFEVFFGGNDPSWASSSDTHIDFADFSIRAKL